MSYHLPSNHMTKAIRPRQLSGFCLAILLATTGIAMAQDAQPAAPADATPSPAAAMTQAEIIRRQELVFRATQAIAEGEKAEANGDVAKAFEKYQFALDNLNTSDNAAAAIQRARGGVARISLAQYELCKKKGDTAGAVKALETAVKYDPSNEKAKDLLADLQAVQKEPGKTKVLGNPAVTPQHVANVKAVEQFMVEAEQYRRTGQLDEAEATLKKVLAIDKYNQKAMQALEQITVEKAKAARIARDATREQRLRQVEEKWSPAVKRKNVSDPTVGPGTPFTRSNQFNIDRKLKSMVIKDLVFNDATIEDAANALAAKSKELDGDAAKLGISFIVKPEALTSAKTFSLNLRNIPMEDALRYITKLADVKYKVEEFAVVIVPLKESTEVLLRRSFNVPPSFFPAPALTQDGKSGGGSKRPLPIVAGGASEGGNNDVKTQLEERGVDFKTTGSSAVYYPGSGVLTVTNTQEQLDMIEELVNAGATPTYMIDVQTKLVEIAQTDLNELTVNTGIYAPNLTGSFGTNPNGSIPLNTGNVPSGQAAGSTALRGSQGFNVGGLDSLLHGNNAPQPNIFNISGQLGAQAFSIVIAAMSQKRSFDLLSNPSLRVKNGEDATINISRTFFYPTAFDPAESATIAAASNSSGVVAIPPPIVIPAFPTEFESRDIGVKMKVRPQLGADNKTIDLALFPEVTDFEGFVNYGSPIFVTARNSLSDPNSATTQLRLSNNVVNQPIFNTRRVDTKVFVRDGNTVVLGGLMRDDVQTITDKVPFFGDLPLVGRLFQSKATQSQKKNLLIFVTCRIYLNSGELLNPPEPTTPVAANATTVGAQ